MGRLAILLRTVGIIIIVVVVTFVLILPNCSCSKKTRSTGVSDWKTYRSDSLPFEIKYPPELRVEEVSDGVLIFTHSIPHQHLDPCNFGDSAIVLKELVDFHVRLRIVPKGFRETVMVGEIGLIADQLSDSSLTISPGWIDSLTFGQLKGYRIQYGVEGCGGYRYYFPLSSQQTLFITRKLVTELNPIIVNYKDYLRLPGIIVPEEEEKFFDGMLATFKLNQ
ncbi:MAG: hypothetical protein L0Y74_04780 [candidate division Zixibacteria bacterium]|nr:hypothetical protein [candidate division Zixibacteria bacterium]